MPRRPRNGRAVGPGEVAVLDFLKRMAEPGTPQPLEQPTPSAVVTDHAATMHFRAKSGEPARFPGRPDPAALTAALLEGVALDAVEFVAARDAEYGDARPVLERPGEARQWLRAHEGSGPVARHAILVLESSGAADFAVDGLACALLHGDRDADGYPEEDAVVGGYASRWDEETGSLLVRAVVAWGGPGLRGDTERQAAHLIAALQARLGARAEEAPEDSATGAREAEPEAPLCPHCGFELASPRAMFCAKCGMRVGQG